MEQLLCSRRHRCWLAQINTNGYIRGLSFAGSRYGLSLFRIIGGSLCYLAQVIGSLILIVGSRTGLYIAAIGLVINFYFMVSGSWLLIVGILHGSDEASG